jgi:hypothetical protein
MQVTVGHIRLPSAFIHRSDVQKNSANHIEEKKRLLQGGAAAEPKPIVAAPALSKLKEGTLLDQVRKSSSQRNFNINFFNFLFILGEIAGICSTQHFFLD